MFDAFGKIAKTEGLKTFYRGAGVGNEWMNGFIFVCEFFVFFKKKLFLFSNDENSLVIYNSSTFFILLWLWNHQKKRTTE